MIEIIDFFKNYGWQMIITIIIGYLLGSISFSIIFTRIFENKDIRDMGSGNAGFTNVLRSTSKLPSILTFICDFSKSALAIYIGHQIFEFFPSNDPYSLAIDKCGAYLIGLACILGHMYPCYFGFRGGKGVLTAAAIMLMIDFRVFVIIVAVFVIALTISKIVSLSSICAAISLPISSFCISYFLDYLPNKNLYYSDYTVSYVVITTIMATLIGALVIFKHKFNIKRLLTGEEKRVSVNKKLRLK